ncbi:hypothetical protein [Curtobacterium aetherium]|uniref:Uncharacterized protein n=1 Tax=Curtobacterium aetherium TaxID=2841594 RepID=A0ACD1E286_9MICO|nr:hypothetical protein [Curtobacterium sp. L6-1]QWS33042.1 hypothetical protein KM842_12380 [Curtobacterium sp. L6-1]
MDETSVPTTLPDDDASETTSGGDGKSSDFIEAFQWRADDNMVALRFRSGVVRGFSGDALHAIHAKDFAMVEVYPWRRSVFFKTTRGDGFSSRFGSRFNSSPLRDRPVVYLDQNQWSTLSKSVHAPWRVQSDDELKAAWRLIGLASSGRVVLPLSAAHLGETGSFGNDEGRYELAVAILSCSGGWQMRDPLQVRAAEFRQVLARSSGKPAALVPDVFTLEPYAALDPATREGSSPRKDHAELPAEWTYAYTASLSSMVYASMMLDQQATPRGDMTGWVQRVQEFSTWLSGETNRTKQQRRRAAEVFMFSDATREIARASFDAGLSLSEMSAWTQSTWHLPELGAPAISLFRATMIDKLLGSGRWEGNDLTDLFYLCTAAGYADHVVGERRTIGLLEQSVRRLHAPVKLHRTLASVVDALSSEQ